MKGSFYLVAKAQIKYCCARDDSISYTYDPDGLRTSKTVNGTTTKYHVMNGTLLGQTKGSDTIVFLYDEKANRYGFDYNGTKYYYIFNVQGDVIGILNQAGQKIVSYTYDPWGKVLSVDGSEASTIGQINPIRYRGYYYDTETGFYYLQSRYYDPTVRRFLNPDTLILEDAKIDLISYCKNNPVNYVDPNGNVVFYVGWTGSAALSIGGGGSIVMAVDTEGNMQPLVMGQYGGGIFGASAGQVIGIIWGAETIDDIMGDGAYGGIAYGEAVQIDATLVWNSYSEIIGIELTGAVGAGSPADIHTGKSYTTAVGPRNNIPQLIESLIPSTLPKPPYNPSMDRNYAMYKGYDSIYYREHYGWK